MLGNESRRGLIRRLAMGVAGGLAGTVAVSEKAEARTASNPASTSGNEVITGAWRFANMISLRPANGIGQIVAKPHGSGRWAPFELRHDDRESYIFHLVGGPNMGGNAALIGLGIHHGSRGLFVNNYSAGVGIHITQKETITGRGAYGMFGDQRSAVAPVVRLTASVPDIAPLLVVDSRVPLNRGARLAVFGRSRGREDGYIKGDDGRLVWNQPVEALAGVILRSPNGSRFMLTIADDGALGTRRIV